MYNCELDNDGSMLQTNWSANENEDCPPVVKVK